MHFSGQLRPEFYHNWTGAYKEKQYLVLIPSGINLKLAADGRPSTAAYDEVWLVVVGWSLIRSAADGSAGIVR